MFKTLISITREHCKYYQQILYLAKIDKIRSFKGSDLGWIWALFKPAIRVAVYYLAMQIGFRSTSNVAGANCSYFLWFTTGMIPWFFMSDMITGGATCFIRYKNMVLRSNLPNSIIPSIVTLSNFRVHLIMMVCLVGLFIVQGEVPNIYWIQIPVYMALMLAFTYVWSMTVGLLSIANVDVKNFLSTLYMMVFWLSGILFNISTIDNVYAKAFFAINPVTFIVYGYRNSMCMNMWITDKPLEFGCFAVVFILMMMLAAGLYSRFKEQLADVI